MKLLIMGAPGCGKGTQADIICEKFNIPAISTGAILRDAIAAGTSLGTLAKQFIDNGNLVTDDIVISIVTARLGEDDCKDGYLLDGFPRTITQAETMNRAGIDFDLAIMIKVDDEIIINRIGGRRVCSNCGETYHTKYNPPKHEGLCDSCGSELYTRDDDNPVTVKRRLEAYRSQTEPVIEYYKGLGKLATVDGCGSVQEVSRRVLSALEVAVYD